MTTDVNVVVIGAGVVGLAIARELSAVYRDVYVVDRHRTFGQETSSRNSEVIHSGIYYQTGSLKATLCVKGKKLLYEYCEKHNVPYKKIGKIVVATTSDEEAQLRALFQRSQANGVTDVQWLTSLQISKIEPHVVATAAIFYPTTGIVDAYSLMKSFETETIQQGATMVYGSEVIGIRKIEQCYELQIRDASGLYSFSTNVVINSAGLYADNIARMIGIEEPSYTIYFWKGEYFSVGNGKNKYLNHLIYPVPQQQNTGLGIHATLDLNHRLKLGPNAIYLPDKKVDYTVNCEHKQDFFRAVKSFLPFIEPRDLEPDQAGIRPKLQKPGDVVRDFVIRNEKDKGYPNFINLIGIESPGLTSCLAIAEKVKMILAL